MGCTSHCLQLSFQTVKWIALTGAIRNSFQNREHRHTLVVSESEAICQQVRAEQSNLFCSSYNDVGLGQTAWPSSAGQVTCIKYDTGKWIVWQLTWVSTEAYKEAWVCAEGGDWLKLSTSGSETCLLRGVRANITTITRKRWKENGMGNK